MKKCSTCGIEKDLDLFEPRRKSCRSCRSAQRQARKGSGGPQELAGSVLSPISTYPTKTTSKSALKALEPLQRDPVLEVKKDFRKFLWLVWQHIGLPDPTPVQYDIAYQLQHGPNKLCIQAFRGVGKSFITVTYAAWMLLNDPQLKIMIVSATKDKADANAVFLKRLINEMPVLMHLRPREGQRGSTLVFDVGPARADQNPSVKSVGITGQLTGSRADILVSDDVEILNNSATADMREKLLNLTKEYSAIIKPLETSKIIWLGTPQTEDSIYGKLSGEYTTMIWPARVPGSKLVEAYGPRLSEYVRKMLDSGVPEGTPVDPKRFHNEDLTSRAADYGKAGFELQFMLNTQLSDLERFPLKVKDLVILPEVPPKRAPMKVEWLPDPTRQIKDLHNVAMAGDHFYYSAGEEKQWADYERSILAIDPAGRGKDEMGYAVLKLLNGFIFVRKLSGLMGGYSPENLVFLAKLAKAEEVNEVVVEGNFGDGMFTELLGPVMRANGSTAGITEVTNRIQKERRIIDTLEPVMAQHKLVMGVDALRDDYSSVQKYDSEVRVSKMFVHQLTRVSYAKGALKHDDRLDVLAIGVKHFTDGMSRDHDQSIEDERLRRFQEELGTWVDSAVDPFKSSQEPFGACSWETS